MQDKDNQISTKTVVNQNQYKKLATNDIDGSLLCSDLSDSSTDFISEDDYTWIPWFCSLKGNEFFCEIDEEFIQDSFNLTNLNIFIKFYEYALDVILDTEISDDTITEDQQEIIESEAETLYGLIHARYILTTRGMQLMMEKFRECHFGRCSRILCYGQPLLPVGICDIPKKDSVKLFCPKCEDIYQPRSSRYDSIDGAYFGTTFPHLFFLVYPEWKPVKTSEKYIPRVFGFKVHPSSNRRSREAKEIEAKLKK